MHRETGRFEQKKPLYAGSFRAALVLVAGLLTLTGCGSGQAGCPATPSDSTTVPASGAASPSAEATAAPPKVFTDQELMAISSRVLEPHGGRVEDTAVVRKSYASIDQPPASASTPPILGGMGGILFNVRSAPRETLVKADFDYSQEVMARCATFDQTLSSANGPQRFTIQLLPAAAIGEKAYETKESFDGTSVGVGLRILSGTVSLDMGANTGATTTEEEALNLMSQIAQQFVDEMKNSY